MGANCVAMVKTCIRCGKEFSRLQNMRRRLFCGPDCRKASVKTMEGSFWEKVNKDAPSGCWEWTASRKEKGYGQFLWHSKMHRAHRLAWILLKGDPGKLEVAHRCDNRICVNPDHLFLATHAENMADCMAKGRHAKGEQTKQSKLTAEQVREIRRNPPKKGQYRECAERYGVKSTHIGRILAGAFWKHIQ